MASKCGASLSFVALTAVFGLVVPLAGRDAALTFLQARQSWYDLG